MIIVYLLLGWSFLWFYIFVDLMTPFYCRPMKRNVIISELHRAFYKLFILYLYFTLGRFTFYLIFIKWNLILYLHLISLFMFITISIGSDNLYIYIVQWLIQVLFHFSLCCSHHLPTFNICIICLKSSILSEG